MTADVQGGYQYERAADWFAKQPESVQNQIAGPTRAGWLRDGTLKMSDMAVPHDHAIWGRSWHPAPVKELRKQVEAIGEAAASGKTARPLAAQASWVRAAKGKPVAPESFVGFRERNKRPQMLTPHDAQWYRDNKAVCYKLPGADAGYALYRDADNNGKLTLISLHNNSGIPGLGRVLVEDAIAHGAEALDCYAPFLPKFYGRHGFVEVGRLKWDDAFAPEDWDYRRDHRPDIVLMERRKR